MPTAAKPEPLTFELRYRRECYRVEPGPKLVRIPERDAEVPEHPAWFKPLRGFHGQVHDEAKRLNRVQERSGFLDYFYFPEVAGV
jgi:hypothetical protein